MAGLLRSSILWTPEAWDWLGGDRSEIWGPKLASWWTWNFRSLDFRVFIDIDVRAQSNPDISLESWFLMRLFGHHLTFFPLPTHFLEGWLPNCQMHQALYRQMCIGKGEEILEVFEPWYGRLQLEKWRKTYKPWFQRNMWTPVLDPSLGKSFIFWEYLRLKPMVKWIV